MTILGIDPGTRRTGYGIVTWDGEPRLLSAGVIALSDDEPLADRLALLHRELRKILTEFTPRVTVVEKIFFGRNADSAFKLGHARGVCLAAAADAGSGLAEYAARHVKKVITGNGAADKEHVGVIVAQRLRFAPGRYGVDATDALALAICHGQEMDVRQRLEGRAQR